MKRFETLPTRESVKILAQTILPYSLHGINPRIIMGEKEWGKVKKNVQILANHHCMCCGRYVQHIPGDWLETHEMYNVDREKCEIVLTGVVGLCNDCHNFIHQGRLRVQLSQGEISMGDYERILRHGNGLLDSFGLMKEDLPAEEIRNSKWCLVHNGKKYKNAN